MASTPAPTRGTDWHPPWLSLPSDLPGRLAPAIPAIMQRIIETVPEQIPAYVSARDGRYGENLTRGVTAALEQLMSLPGTARPALSPETRALMAYLGAGEFREGRTMDALLGAYRASARIVFRDLSAECAHLGMGMSVVIDLGESIWAYIDELSAASVAGHGADGPFEYRAAAVINCTGTWDRPFWPTVAGAPSFRGTQLHAHDYRTAEPFAGKTVAVVGAGPAGLSCAHRLAAKGHEVVVFEARPKPGGLNEYGIASYKAVDGFAAAEVEPGRRLVEQHEFGVGHQGARDLHPLALPLGQRAEAAVREVLGPHGLEHVDGAADVDLVVALAVGVDRAVEVGTPCTGQRSHRCTVERVGAEGGRVAHARGEAGIALLSERASHPGGEERFLPGEAGVLHRGRHVRALLTHRAVDPRAEVGDERVVGQVAQGVIATREVPNGALVVRGVPGPGEDHRSLPPVPGDDRDGEDDEQADEESTEDAKGAAHGPERRGL